MPPLSYPDKITYYAFCRTIHPLFARTLGVGPVDIGDIQRRAMAIRAIRHTEDGKQREGQEIDDEQMRLIEELEAYLEEVCLWRASTVLSMDSRDWFGNIRPYETEGISEPMFQGISLYADDMTAFLAVFEGAEAHELKVIYRDLGKHPFFRELAGQSIDWPDAEQDASADEGEESGGYFGKIETMFEVLRQNGPIEDWIVVAILRSYYLHNS